MLTFDFPEKDLGLVYPPHFVHNFSRKLLHMLYSINDQISLFDDLYFWRYWAIAVLQSIVNQTVTS